MEYSPQGRTLSAKEAAAFIGVGKKKFRRLRATGQFPAPLNPQDRYKLWSRESVESWLRQKNPVA